MSDDKLRMTPAAVQAMVAGDVENFIAAATPGGIEAQEARGQRDLVRSETLPVQMTAGNFLPPTPGNGFLNPEWARAYELLESWGVRFGSYDSDNDALFLPATLPDGWKKVATGHSMHSRLLDDQGRWRAGIFYKAAFYDRRADMRLETRIALDLVSTDRVKQGKDAPMVHHAKVIVDRRGIRADGEHESSEVMLLSKDYAEADFEHSYDARDAARTEATTLVDAAFPDWRDPAAYWDADVWAVLKKVREDKARHALATE